MPSLCIKRTIIFIIEIRFSISTNLFSCIFDHLGLPCPCCPATRPNPPTSHSGPSSGNSENSNRETSQAQGLVEGSIPVSSSLPTLDSPSSAQSSLIPLIQTTSSSAPSFSLLSETIHKG